MVKWKDPYKNDIQTQATWFQPLLKTEVEKSLSAATASAPIFNMTMSRFLQCSTAIFFPPFSLLETNAFQPGLEIWDIVRCWWSYQSGVLAFRFCCFPLGFPTLFCGISLCIFFTFCNRQWKKEKGKWKLLLLFTNSSIYHVENFKNTQKVWNPHRDKCILLVINFSWRKHKCFKGWLILVLWTWDSMAQKQNNNWILTVVSDHLCFW